MISRDTASLGEYGAAVERALAQLRDAGAELMGAPVVAS